MISLKKPLYFIPLFLLLLQLQTSGLEKDKVGITEYIGEKVPGNITLLDSSNKIVTLDDFYSENKPILVNLVYFNCPLLCSQILESLTDSLQRLTLPISEKFKVLTISFDPKDTLSHSQAYKSNYISKLNKEGANENWHFLTANQENITQITSALGFNYTYDETLKEYLHTSTLFILTPSGKISRYIYGIEFDPFDLKLSLLEASKNKFISSVDKIILYCYNYNPSANSYSLAAMNVMKIGALFTLFVVIGILVYLNKKDVSRQKN